MGTYILFRVSLRVVSGEWKNGIFYSGFGVWSFGSGAWGLRFRKLKTESAM